MLHTDPDLIQSAYLTVNNHVDQEAKKLGYAGGRILGKIGKGFHLNPIGQENGMQLAEADFQSVCKMSNGVTIVGPKKLTIQYDEAKVTIYQPPVEAAPEKME